MSKLQRRFMNIIASDKIPSPNGHYTPCIEHNGMLYLSGQLPFDPMSRTVADDIEGQTLQVLNNVLTIVEAAGSKKDQIIQMRLYIPDMDMWDRINAVYGDFFGDHRPTRCIVPTRELHYGCLIEVEATAFI